MYRNYGDRPITSLDMCRTSLDDASEVNKRWEDLVEIIGEDVASIAGGVLDAYGKYTGNELVGMTHRKKTPWKKAYKPGRNNVIPTKEIRQFYKDLDADDERR